MPGSTAYPGVVDAFTNPDASAGHKLGTPAVAHDEQHGSANDAIEAIETILGTDPHVIDATVTVDTTPETVREKIDVAYRRIADLLGTTWDTAIPATIATIWGKFHASTGHTHSGASNAAPPVTNAANLRNAGYITLTQIATPTTPASGEIVIYSKSDDKMYRKTDAGTEIELGSGGGGGGGTVHTDPFATPPGAPATGDLWFPEDTDYTGVFDGADWAWYLKGYPVTLPDDADFSWYNQKSAGLAGSVDTTRGGVYLFSPADTADSITMRVKTIPSAPYTIEAYLEPAALNSNYTAWGIGVKQSSDNHFIQMGLIFNGGVIHTYVSQGNTTSVASNYVDTASGDQSFRWMRMIDDNTNRSYWYSHDGYHWIKYYQHARTTFITPDRAYVFVNTRNADGFDAGVWLRHWKES